MTAVTAPTAPNASGWYRSLVIDWQCSGGAACTPETKTVTTQGTNLFESATSQDALGNPGSGSFGPFKFDSVAPPNSTLSSPSNGTTVAAEPTFAWHGVRGQGPERRDLQRLGNRSLRALGELRQRRHEDRDPPGPKHNTALPSEYADLAQLKDIEWWVKAIDLAGNVSGESGHRKFRIDPSVPPGPTITSGPGAQTNDTTPSFNWSGNQPSFNWSVIPSGANNPVQQGSGMSSQVTLGTLAPGDYTFRVVQVSAAGVESAETTYPFTLDTTPPAPPVIDTRPINGSKDITPAFSWRGEVHATYTWRVIGAGGSVVRGDSTQDTSLTLAPLTPGPYTFQISQTDRAGNTSSVTAEPFSIIGPSGLQAGTKLSLPTTNHRRLKPAKGVTVPTRRPVLRWTVGPRGTTLYNVQLFRVMKRSSGKTRVAKVFSTFPRTLQYRVPSKRTRPATCYVWRVWPYLGTRFTKQPLGISNFCIANKSVLRKVAQRKAARTRAARAARPLSRPRAGDRARPARERSTRLVARVVADLLRPGRSVSGGSRGRSHRRLHPHGPRGRRRAGAVVRHRPGLPAAARGSRGRARRAGRGRVHHQRLAPGLRLPAGDAARAR